MRKKLLFPLLGLVMLTGLFALVGNVPAEQKYFARNNKRVAQKDATGYVNWLLSRRANPLTGTVDIADVSLARQQADALSGSRSLGLAWEEMGPNNVGGRTRAFLIDRTNHNRFYAGGVGGGLWYSNNAGSTWQRINGSDGMDVLSVASICQSIDNYIYFGTGEGFYQNTGDGSGGLEGKGIFKSSTPSTSAQAAVNFAQLASTWGTIPIQNIFKNVNKMAASPTNSQRIYAATKQGMRISNDGGATWANALGTNLSVGQDVDIASDGTVIIAVGNRGYRSASGDSGTFTPFTQGTNPPAFPQPGALSRVEFAIAPSNPNIIYASAAASSGALYNVYQSTDQGSTWSIIGPGGASTVFGPFGGNNQGWYDNALGVAPNDPYKIFLGGVELWRWSLSGGWAMIDCWYCWDQSPYYSHADKHNIVFHPDDPYTMFVISDGGVARSTNQGNTFTRHNKNYNTVQYYSVAVDPNGNPMGGTQDNGTQYITGRYSVASNGDTLINDPQFAWEVMGGDGGQCAFSTIYPATMSPALGVEVGAAFAEGVNGEIRRSNGGTFTSFFDNNIDNGSNPPAYNGSWITPFALWESKNDLLSNDSVIFGLADSLSQILVSSISSNTSRRDSGNINYSTYFQSSAHIDSTLPGSVLITDGVHFAVDNGAGQFIGDVDNGHPNYIHYSSRSFDVTFNTSLTVDSALTIYYKIKYEAGQTISVTSATASLPITYTLPSSMLCGDTIKIQDIVQARFVAGLTAPGGNCLWMTKRALDFSQSKPQWFKIANGLSGSPECIVFSKDGNHLFVGTSGGTVYRISNLSQVTDSMSGWVTSPTCVITKTAFSPSLGGTVTGIDVSESNPNKVIATVGGYGPSIVHVRRSLNALGTTPTMASIQTNLPSMPVYDVVINNVDDNKLILGTELGIWASDDNGVSWSEENLGMARTAVFMLRQYNAFTGGAIYAATHGRGIFKSTTLVGINDPETPTLGSIGADAVRVYPNPMTANGFADYVLNQSASVDVEIYDIRGTLLKSNKLGKLASGLHHYTFDAASLKNGTYFLVVRAGSEKATGRFVIVK